METGLSIFSSQEFGKVRAFLRDGEPWFVAADVAKALGYAVPQKAVSDHCKYAELFKCSDMEHLTDSPRGINIIPEADVYALIFRSKLEKAERFRDWVCKEVLPQIRKTGSYGKPALPTDYLSALKALVQSEEEKLQALERERVALEANAQFAAQNEELRTTIGFATEWKQVIAIDFLYEYFDMKDMTTLQQIGRALSNMSKMMGKEVNRAPHPKYRNGVGVYHISVVEALRVRLMHDPNFLDAYRRK